MSKKKTKKGLALAERPKATKTQIERARREYQTDEVEIDNDALTSHAPDGVWVQAWVWLPKESE